MNDLITFKNAQISALQNLVADQDKYIMQLETNGFDVLADQDKYIMQLETYVFELTDQDSPEEYKSVIRNEVFGTDYE